MSDTSATTQPLVSAFRWVPDFARGLVRDLRVRWALEEIGRPYRTVLMDAAQPRDAEYRAWQPFGQVPAFDDGAIRLFESGAILLYLGEQDETLLPTDPAGRWAATAWTFAALNSIEPAVSHLVSLDLFHANDAWSAEAREPALEFVNARLRSLADALGELDWLTGRFTVADILMVTVLRNLHHTNLVAAFPNLAAYQARGEARPAFQRAMNAQINDLSNGDTP